MSSRDSHFKRKPLYEVLTFIDRCIRTMVLDTGFGELNVEFSPSGDPRQLRIIVKNTAHHFYQVAADDMRQLLNSGPHFSADYVSSELWQTLGHRFHAIFGEGGTGYGHICLSTAKGRHQQVFKIGGGISHQIHVNYSEMNL
ncbi:transporter family protein [Leptothoe spongobia]|uniref:Uncharacterized protein n=1 Tax=Leptothoe spongobia TAU-MAC 1115 TaxID=1967444 RepID=A0A947DER3_9CYAN|nr:hypothetical protein [Leptothoe spongobia]MBT9314541.1 hypothetical protein [Leptothoe spongobia TAU-MAC 1115]